MWGTRSNAFEKSRTTASTCGNYLGFAWMAGSETMLDICKNIVFVTVFRDLAEYYMLNQLTADEYVVYRAIIGWCGSVAILVDWGNVCIYWSSGLVSCK